MNVTENQYSILRLKDLRFTKLIFLNPNRVFNAKLKFKVKREINEISKTEFYVKLDFFVISELDDEFQINISIVGKFEINCEDDVMKKELISKNSVAILFPYLRSELTIITAQPGFEPIIIPPININALLDENED